MHPGELALAAMVDMMINILMFLLTLYGTDPISIQPNAELDVPTSNATRPVVYAPDLRVTTTGVVLDGERLMSFENGYAWPAGAIEGGVVKQLQRRLEEASQARGPAPADADDETKRIDIQCDKRMPWSVLGPIVQTAAASGFAQYRFIVRTTGSTTLPSD